MCNFLFNVFIYMLDFIFSVLGVLLSVAFFTLMERKVMGNMHYRKGPNKIIIWGLLQPISDALKLLTKEFPKFYFLKMIMFFIGPTIMIIIMTMCWIWYDFCFLILPNFMKLLIILSLMSLSSYGFMLMSWGSNSKYSIVGGYRVVAQVISYEVCLMFFVMTIIYVAKSYNLESLKLMQDNAWFLFYSMPLFFTWILLCMAESNRTPFDLAEGESEIVSGFNIEYGGGLFAFIFISEYGMIIFLSFLTTLLFMGKNFYLMKIFIMCFIYIWIRCCFPRVRYDMLMFMSWKLLLPFSICMVILSMCL